jgi:hypothetical protein
VILNPAPVFARRPEVASAIVRLDDAGIVDLAGLGKGDLHALTGAVGK